MNTNMKTSSNPKTDRYLKKYYLLKPVNQLAGGVGRSETFVTCRLRQLGLCRPLELIEKFKQMGRVKPGSVPPNKGLPQKEWLSKAGRKKVRKTQFKKGSLPHNTKSDYEISVRKDNRGVEYQHIRVSLAKWIPLHRYNWELSHGKIPAKMKLVFKDGDTMNAAIENLEILTPGQLMERNSWHRYPEEIGKAIQLRGALNRQINKHLKKLKDEKQNNRPAGSYVRGAGKTGERRIKQRRPGKRNKPRKGNLRGR